MYSFTLFNSYSYIQQSGHQVAQARIEMSSIYDNTQCREILRWKIIDSRSFQFVNLQIGSHKQLKSQLKE